MSFTARYDGRCGADADCRYGDAKIRVGDDIQWADDDRYEVIHTQCAAARRRQPPQCPHCFTHHAGECL